MSHEAVSVSPVEAIIPERLQFEVTSMDIEDINVLSQPRIEFEGMPEMAADIARNGIIHPLTVALFDYTSCQAYVELVNMLWRANHSIDELATLGNDGATYAVLIAGERRLRSCRHLREHGCRTCTEQGLVPEVCFTGHFPDGIRVQTSQNVPASIAARIQLSENTHKRVPPEQEALMFSRLYGLLANIEPSLTKVGFADSVGISTSTLAKALAYSELPTKVQVAVEEGYLIYGCAVELARLQKVGIDEESIIGSWLDRFIVSMFNTDEAHEVVSRELERMGSQEDLFGEFDDAQRALAERQAILRTVERNGIQGVWTVIKYLRRVVQLGQEGKFSGTEIAFSLGSPKRVFMALICVMEEAFELFKEHGSLSPGEEEQTERVLGEARRRAGF